jgi:hypothetical protein
MNAIHRLFSFLLCATIAMLWLLANTYAQSNNTKTCAIVANILSPNIPMQSTAADQLHQMIRSKIYAACLQTDGNQVTSGMAAPGQAGTNTTNAGAFITFDIPGASSTFPTGINPAGTVTGYFRGAGGLHSFLRTSDGAITPFDPCSSCSSAAVGITPGGTIAGSYADTGGRVHGYLRAPNGAFTVFDGPPGSQVFGVTAISGAGTVMGSFADSTGRSHGYLRAPNGTFTSFDVLGSALWEPEAINPARTVSGTFVDVRGVFHGFMRTSDGTTTAVDPVGSTDTEFLVCINPAGAIAGRFLGTHGVQGFLRAPDGTFTEVAPPGSFSTQPNGITPAGTIVGNFIVRTGRGSFEVHGFLRAPDGTFTVFDVPGSINPTFINPTAINPAGTVTGYVFELSGGIHGFVGRP